MNIVKYPDPVLLKKATPVALNEETLAWIEKFEDFYKNGLTWGKAVGLAAPQVGESIRVFI
ncbi:peptide deformylase, partial [Escherichia coli]|uniref:peptide deformylase n=1 Tax=Escherichia coli TaxID=562 RepID=UPI003D032560